MRRIARLSPALGFALALGAAAPTARADGDPIADTVEGQQRDLGLGMRAAEPSGLWWDAFAQLVGEGATQLATRERHLEGTAAVGAELRVVGRRCTLVRLGGQARLAWSGGARPSAEQWASACLPTPIFGFELGHHLEWDVRPSLLAPIQLRAGLNRRETLSVHLEPFSALLSALTPPELRSPDAPPSRLVLFALDSQTSFLWSAGGSLAWRQQMDVIGLRYEREQLAPWGQRRDFTVDVGAARGELTEHGGAVHAWLVHVGNLALGPLFATAGLGFSSAVVGPLADGTGQHTAVTTPRALVALETGGAELRGHVRGQHDVALVADGFSVLDSRLAGGLSLDAARTRVDLDGFAGRTEIRSPVHPLLRGATGGASLSLARTVGAHLEATLQLEVARSLYARGPDAMPTAELGPPRWGASAMAALQATAGSRRR